MHGASGHRKFIGIAALCFVASVAVTVSWCGSMAPGGMEMPGGWTMSMAWMRMPGQGWPGAAATFVGMWSVMMIAMMLPALVPMLMRYRQRLRGVGERRRAWLTARAAASYFTAWTMFGMLVFPAGVAWAELEMRIPAIARFVPFMSATVLMIAGALQLSPWKRRQLVLCQESDCCRAAPADAGTAWRHGFDLGLRCIRCCAPLTAALFVLGVMDLAAMGLITAAIGIERLLPHRVRAARAIGVALLVAGILPLTNA